MPPATAEARHVYECPSRYLVTLHGRNANDCPVQIFSRWGTRVYAAGHYAHDWAGSGLPHHRQGLGRAGAVAAGRITRPSCS